MGVDLRRIRAAFYDPRIDSFLYQRIFRNDVRLYHQRSNHSHGYRGGAARTAVLAKPNPFAGWYGFFDIDGDISAARHGRAALISGRVEPRSGNHQREIHPPQPRHDGLALGNLYDLEPFGNPLVMSGRNVAFRFIVSFIRNRVDIRLFPLERQHRALQQRLL